jgi:MFS family permease
VVNAYTVGLAAFILTAGALGDRIGAKRVFIAGFALLASLGCALAPNLACSSQRAVFKASAPRFWCRTPWRF